MALATLNDVKYVLGIATSDTSYDTQLQAALDAAESWVKRRCRRTFDGTGSATATFNNVREDETLDLDEENVTVTEVRVFVDRTGVGTVLGSSGYQVIDSRRVQLVSTLTVIPFEGAVASRLPNFYDKVTVTYTMSGTVPAAVKKATAMLAANLHEQGKSQASGKTSETLGDYSYSVALAQGESAVPPMVKNLLAPFIRNRIQVI